MELDKCAICNRETPDPLLWPPEARNRIVVCEECFIELFVVPEKLFSKAKTIPLTGVALGSESAVDPLSSEVPPREPGVKNRRSAARWAIKRSAKMSWLARGIPVSAKVQLLDGSEHGLGIRSQKAIEAGQGVRVILAGAVLRGDVCHCQPAKRGFRLGVLLRNVRLLPSE